MLHVYSCFLSHAGAFWGAFLAPVLAVMVFNMVIFIWVIVILIRHTRATAARKSETVSKGTIVRLMISISGVMFLFGLTWLFAILTFSIPVLREAFQILFVVFNSFQGFFIFLFFCVFNKEALESWAELLSCGKYKSKLLHPSQAKFSSSAAAKKTKQTKTASTGFSSSSGGKYASDTSKSDYHSTVPTMGKEFESEAEIEKIPLESKGDLGTPEPNKASTEEATPIDEPQQQQNGSGGTNAGKKEEEKGKKKITTSLKARIKRYSTKKVSKHHVEEAEVDFNSDDSDSGEEDQL